MSEAGGDTGFRVQGLKLGAVRWAGCCSIAYVCARVCGKAAHVEAAPPTHNSALFVY